MSTMTAAEALQEAAVALGLAMEEVTEVKMTGKKAGTDFVVINPAGGRVTVHLKRLSLASAGTLHRQVAQWKRDVPRHGIGVVVADRVTRDARDFLRTAGWGWLDLRGHLHLAGRGFFIDADVPSLGPAPGRSNPLAGRVGVEVAALLLLNPDTPAAIRGTASVLGRAPSSVSQVLSSMQESGLLDEERKPVVPDLFWQLATHWQSRSADVQSLPSVSTGDPVQDALRLGLEDAEKSTGWALTDTMAAAEYGAPVSARADHPLDFYVPDESTLRRAVLLLGPARDHDGRAARLRVAPVPMICTRRVDLRNRAWPLAQPLFVALDLAQDPGRGREILNGWTPTNPVNHVW